MDDVVVGDIVLPAFEPASINNKEVIIKGVPLREGLKDGTDYILVSKGLWRLFQKEYKGVEIRRYSIRMDKVGSLYRDAQFTKLKIALIRRGDKVKYPKVLFMQKFSTFGDLKHFSVRHQNMVTVI